MSPADSPKPKRHARVELGIDPEEPTDPWHAVWARPVRLTTPGAGITAPRTRRTLALRATTIHAPFDTETGSEATGVRHGDLVVASFIWSDGVCDYCRAGLTTSCEHGGFAGLRRLRRRPGRGRTRPLRRRHPRPAGQGRRLAGPPLSALLPLSDVMGTGHHAALGAGARPGATVAVVGDGAVGLCAVLAAKRLGAMGVPPVERSGD